MRQRHGAAVLATLVIISVRSAPARAHHPHDPIDSAALAPGYGSNPTLLIASAGSLNLVLRSGNGGRIWRESRTGLRSHEISALCFATDADTSGVIYAAGSPGGVQRSSDGGHTWAQPIRLGNFGHLGLAPVSSQSQTLFYATDRSLYRSEDGGLSDQLLHTLPEEESRRIVALAVSPSYFVDSTMVVVGSDSCAYISGDSGQTFQRTHVGVPLTSAALSPYFADDHTLWLTTLGAGVLHSTDGGCTFAPRSTGLDDLDANSIATAPTYPAPPDLWVATRNAGVYRSTNGGEEWFLSSLDTPRSDQTSSHFRSVHVSPDWPEDQSLFCGAFEGLFGSLDGGGRWRQANINPPRMSRAITPSPNFLEDHTVFAVGYGMHALVSRDHGSSWTIEYENFNAVSAYCMATSPTFADDSMLIVGVGHGLRITRDFGRTWNSVELAPFDSTYAYNSVRSVSFSPAFGADSTIFCVSNGGFYRSTDGGMNWSNNPPVLRRMWELALSPSFASDSTIFVAGPDWDTWVHRSQNGGRTWQPVGDRPTPVTGFAISPDFAQSGIIFAVSESEGVLRSTDWGTNWAPYNNQLANHAPTALKLSAQYADNGISVVATAGGGIHESVAFGPWQRLTPPNSPVDHAFSLALSPGYPEDGTIFAGTYDGILRSTDRGVTWMLTTGKEIYDDRRTEPWLVKGHWTRIAWPDCINMGYSKADDVGAAISLNFTGLGARVIGTRGPDHGIMRARIDGGNAVFVDAYAPELQTLQTLAEFTDLPLGFHVLHLEIDANKNAESSDHAVGVDAVEITYYQHNGRAEAMSQ